MTDLAQAVKEARDDLHETVPLLQEAFLACWGVLYSDARRWREDRDDPSEPRERVQRCGACEHPDDHNPRCDHQGCRCRAWEPMPSTVGWAEWTGPGKAECMWNRAVEELQRAHDCLATITTVPAVWMSDALLRPASRRQPIHVGSVTYGVTLLKAAVRHVGDDLAPPEASALMEAADHARAALKALRGAEDPIPLAGDKPGDPSLEALSQHRCAEPGCRVGVHADRLCREHYDRRRRGTMTCLEHDLEIVMDTGRPDPRLVVCRNCRRRWKLSRMNHSRVVNG